ncbi:hypothetical protein C8F04DRAFT_1189201 [Mycena alexandri]|uniref:Uncharacterized protein n=1 Tax=Mycena alexandri TaxID=1745969 RepID=A0AAD6SHN1_9AGAR|nr:hypothetical protein C8F04DRAFT_1189201 [Mycena alexandri]
MSPKKPVVQKKQVFLSTAGTQMKRTFDSNVRVATPAERVFSSGSLTGTKWRNSLTTELFEALQLLKKLDADFGFMAEEDEKDEDKLFKVRTALKPNVEFEFSVYINVARTWPALDSGLCRGTRAYNDYPPSQVNPSRWFSENCGTEGWVSVSGSLYPKWLITSVVIIRHRGRASLKSVVLRVSILLLHSNLNSRSINSLGLRDSILGSKFPSKRREKTRNPDACTDGESNPNSIQNGWIKADGVSRAQPAPGSSRQSLSGNFAKIGLKKPLFFVFYRLIKPLSEKGRHVGVKKNSAAQENLSWQCCDADNAGASCRQLDPSWIKKVESPPEKAKSRRRVVKFWPQKAKIQTRKSQNLALKKPKFRTSFGANSDIIPEEHATRHAPRIDSYNIIDNVTRMSEWGRARGVVGVCPLNSHVDTSM